MLTLCRLLFSSLLSLVRSRAALQAEILALRHQLQVLERSARGRRLRLRTADRIFWVWLSRLWTGWRSCVRIVQPATVISWNRKGFRVKVYRIRTRENRPSGDVSYLKGNQLDSASV
jgi:putative transposase